MGGIVRGGMATEAYAAAQAASAQAAAIAADLGVGQAWQDLTASRAKNTIYTNTTGKPIHLCITGTASSGPASIRCDGVIVGWMSTVAQQGGGVVVPAGSTYELNQPAGTLVMIWSELR